MADTKYKQWIEMIKSGGAFSLFYSYQEDEVLADKLNALFPGEDVITAEQITRDRKRYYQLPRRGEVRDEKKASPTKNVILNKARQLDVYEAFAEIFDNIFDNFERNAKLPTHLKISVTAYPPTGASSGELIIQENSGGIPEERYLPLIQLGASDRVSGSGGIGAWGEGFKMAAFALGEEIEIFSHYPNESPVAIYFPRGWLDPKHRSWTQWKVDIFDVEQNVPDIGTTVIRLKFLSDSVLNFLKLNGEIDTDLSDEAARKMAQYFGEVYGEKYHSLVESGHEITFSINIRDSQYTVAFADRVKSRLEKNLAFLPWLKPILWNKVWTTKIESEARTAKLEATIYGGLLATDNYSPSYTHEISNPGVEMWGNGRKFSLKGRITDESVGWGYTFGGSGGRNPTSGSSYRRIMIVILFESEESRDIPWAAPVKNDYNRRSEFYAEIQDALARIIRLFKDAHSFLEFALIPFSHSWNGLSQEEKLEVLFRDVKANSEQLSEFTKSSFGIKVLKYKPSLVFKTIEDSDPPPTINNLYGLSPAKVRNILTAAASTKQDYRARVEFLKAIFPSLSRQALIEEKLMIKPNEELIL